MFRNCLSCSITISLIRRSLLLSLLLCLCLDGLFIIETATLFSKTSILRLFNWRRNIWLLLLLYIMRRRRRRIDIVFTIYKFHHIQCVFYSDLILTCLEMEFIHPFIRKCFIVIKITKRSINLIKLTVFIELFHMP